MVGLLAAAPLLLAGLSSLLAAVDWLAAGCARCLLSLLIVAVAGLAVGSFTASVLSAMAVDGFGAAVAADVVSAAVKRSG